VPCSLPISPQRQRFSAYANVRPYNKLGSGGEVRGRERKAEGERKFGIANRILILKPGPYLKRKGKRRGKKRPSVAVST